MRAHPRPKTSEEFERVCLEYLRREWNRPSLTLYGKSGYGQYGVDIVDTENAGDCWVAQCKLHEDGKALQAAEVLAEVVKRTSFHTRSADMRFAPLARRRLIRRTQSSS